MRLRQLIPSLLLLGATAAPAQTGPLEGSYATFMAFCAESMANGKACEVFYARVFKGFRDEEAAGRLTCERELSSKVYFDLHKRYLEAGQGAALNPREFVTTLYKDARRCSP